MYVVDLLRPIYLAHDVDLSREKHLAQCYIYLRTGSVNSTSM